MPIWTYICLMARAATTSDAFNAVAEPQRRRILALLKGRERPVNELARALRITQPRTSKHLRVLREVGLVRVREAGQQDHHARVRLQAGRSVGRHDPGARWQGLSEPLGVDGDRAAGAHRLDVFAEEGRPERGEDDPHARRAWQYDRGDTAIALRQQGRARRKDREVLCRSGRAADTRLARRVRYERASG